MQPVHSGSPKNDDHSLASGRGGLQHRLEPVGGQQVVELDAEQPGYQLQHELDETGEFL